MMTFIERFKRFWNTQIQIRLVPPSPKNVTIPVKKETILRFCRDCRFSHTQGDLRYLRCLHPDLNVKGEFLASGSVDDASYASVNRDFEDKCGRAAHHFEPKNETNNKSE